MLYDYHPKKNLFYFSNPSVLIILVFTWVFMALLFNHPLYIGTIFIVISWIIIDSGNYKAWKKQLKFVLPIIIIIVLINSIFNSSGSTNLWPINLWGDFVLSINLEGLVYGIMASFKLLVIISSFSFITLVIDPDKFLNLTRRLGFQISLIINFSARLFPLLITDYRRIHEMQEYRGFKDGTPTTLFEKVKNYIPTLSILLTSSLNRSLTTAESLYCRGYGSGHPTMYNPSVWKTTDYILLGNIILTFTFALLGYMQGWSSYEYYPLLSAFTSLGIFTSLILGFFLFFPILLNWSCKIWLK